MSKEAGDNWSDRADFVIIGAGFAGIALALELLENNSPDYKLVMLEAGEGLFPRASTSANQCWKIHLGLHYAGNLKTAMRCLHSSIRFAERFSDSILGGDNLKSPWRRGRHYVMSGSVIPADKKHAAERDAADKKHAADKSTVTDVADKLKKEDDKLTVTDVADELRKEYARLIKKSPDKKVFGEPDNFMDKLEPEDYTNIVSNRIPQPHKPKKPKNQDVPTAGGGGSKEEEAEAESVVCAYETAESQIDLVTLRECVRIEFAKHNNFTLLTHHTAKRIQYEGIDDGYKIEVEETTTADEGIAVINSVVDTAIQFLLAKEKQEISSFNEGVFCRFRIVNEVEAKIRAFIKRVASSEIVYMEQAIEKIVRLGAEGIVDVKTKFGPKQKAMWTRSVTNCTWKDAELLDKVHGAPEEQQIRAKVTVIAGLPKDLMQLNTSTFSVGPYCSITNLGNGTAVVAYEPKTNIGKYHPNENPYVGDNRLGKFLRSARNPHFGFGKIVADEIMSGARLYFPGLQGAKVQSLNLGFVRYHLIKGRTDNIHGGRESAHHQRLGTGLFGSAGGRLGLFAEKMTVSVSDARAAARAVYNAFMADNEEFQLELKKYFIIKAALLPVLTPLFFSSNKFFLDWLVMLLKLYRSGISGGAYAVGCAGFGFYVLGGGHYSFMARVKELHWRFAAVMYFVFWAYIILATEVLNVAVSSIETNDLHLNKTPFLIKRIEPETWDRGRLCLEFVTDNLYFIILSFDMIYLTYNHARLSTSFLCTLSYSYLLYLMIHRRSYQSESLSESLSNAGSQILSDIGSWMFKLPSLENDLTQIDDSEKKTIFSVLGIKIRYFYLLGVPPTATAWSAAFYNIKHHVLTFPNQRHTIIKQRGSLKEQWRRMWLSLFMRHVVVGVPIPCALACLGVDVFGPGLYFVADFFQKSVPVAAIYLIFLLMCSCALEWTVNRGQLLKLVCISVIICGLTYFSRRVFLYDRSLFSLNGLVNTSNMCGLEGSESITSQVASAVKEGVGIVWLLRIFHGCLDWFFDHATECIKSSRYYYSHKRSVGFIQFSLTSCAVLLWCVFGLEMSAHGAYTFCQIVGPFGYPLVLMQLVSILEHAMHFFGAMNQGYLKYALVECGFIWANAVVFGLIHGCSKQDKSFPEYSMNQVSVFSNSIFNMTNSLVRTTLQTENGNHDDAMLVDVNRP